VLLCLFQYVPVTVSATCMVDVEDTFCFADLLANVFNNLSFDVLVADDLTHDQLVQCMKTQSMRDHQDYNCFICCILSHGTIGAVYGTDGKTVPIKDLTVHFKAAGCQSLRGKPKIFVVQACQGIEKQSGFPCMCFSKYSLFFHMHTLTTT